VTFASAVARGGARQNLLWVALALSLALNLCFIGGALWIRIQGPPTPMYPEERLERIGSELALDPAQVAVPWPGLPAGQVAEQAVGVHARAGQQHGLLGQRVGERRRQVAARARQLHLERALRSRPEPGAALAATVAAVQQLVQQARRLGQAKPLQEAEREAGAADDEVREQRPGAGGASHGPGSFATRRSGRRRRDAATSDRAWAASP